MEFAGLKAPTEAVIGGWVGVKVAVIVGELVGVLVGVIEGELVGLSVGVFVGVMVGVLLGVIVGVFEGELVGVFVKVSVALDMVMVDPFTGNAPPTAMGRLEVCPPPKIPAALATATL